MKRAFAALLLLLLPLTAAAAVVRGGEAIEIPAGETIADDLYVSAGTVRIAGTVNGDLVVSGGTVTVEGPVSGDLIVAGGTLVLEGKVGGSIRAAGGNLTVGGSVAEDLVVAGGTIVVRAPVGRDVLVGGGNVSLEGPISRNVLAGAGELAIRADVGGDVGTHAGRLRVGKVRIGGNLSVPENTEFSLDPGATVGGEVIRTEAIAGPRTPAHRVFAWLRWFVGFLALGGLVGLLAPRWWHASTDSLLASPGRAVLAGLGLLIAVPTLALAIVLLGILLGGWWIGIFVVLLQLMLLALGVSLAAQAVGGVILGKLLHRGGRWFAILALGLLVLLLLGAIPWLGAAVIFAAMLFGGGGLLLGAVRWRRTEPAPPPAPAAR